MFDMAFFKPSELITEIEKRPGLYSSEHPAEREEKLALWKEVGAAIFNDWDTYNKATAYDKVLQLQRKWRSLRDAYNRELRSRRTGIRTNRKVYKYFRKMSFLGGFDGSLTDEETAQDNDATEDHSNAGDEPETLVLLDPPAPKAKTKTKKPRRKPVKRRSTSESDAAPEEIEMPVFPMEIANDASESDSDRLFLLSSLPEMRQLPLNLKMWVRAQIASVMQEAVTCHYTNTQPGSTDRNGSNMKRPRYDSSESTEEPRNIIFPHSAK